MSSASWPEMVPAHSRRTSSQPGGGSAKPYDSYYRKARIVARVLSSTRLKQRAKWCDLAKRLVADPGVSDRLIGQAMHWLALRDGCHAGPLPEL
jgi:hypothetical protein